MENYCLDLFRFKMKISRKFLFIRQRIDWHFPIGCTFSFSNTVCTRTTIDLIRIQDVESIYATFTEYFWISPKGWGCWVHSAQGAMLIIMSTTLGSYFLAWISNVNKLIDGIWSEANCRRIIKFKRSLHIVNKLVKLLFKHHRNVNVSFPNPNICRI